MAEVITKYAVLKDYTKLKLHFDEKVKVPIDHSDEELLICVAGTLIKIFKTLPSSKLCAVQVLDFVGNDAIYENLYEVPLSQLQKVREELWPFIINIVDPKRRVQLLQRPDQCRLAENLKVTDMVRVSGGLYQKKHFDCIVRYIGPVIEIHPVGFFFGLELLELTCGHSPQTPSYAQKYMDVEPNLALFITADYINPIPIESNKNKLFDGLSETFGKVCTAVIGATENSAVRPTRNSKKVKTKGPTAQFYDTPNSTCKKKDFSQDKTTFDMERTTRYAAKSTEAAAVMGVTSDNDDFNQSVQNYEKTLERQHASANKSTSAPPVGILKNNQMTFKDVLMSKSFPFENQDIVYKKTDTRESAKSFSFENKAIIVINKEDILESTKHENEVIVVEKPKPNDVDLVDVLGVNWPNVAGDAASILNRTQKLQQLSGGSSNSSVSSTYQAKTDRNKSANPIAHFNASQRTLDQQKHDTKKLTYAANVSAFANNQNELAHITNSNEVNVAEQRAIANGSPIYDNLVDNANKFKNVKGDLYDTVQSSPFLEVPGGRLGLGSMVEITVPEVSKDLYGVIRWIGEPPGAKSIMVGVELEDEPNEKNLNTTSGKFNGVSLFKCHEGRALFVTPDQCENDRRFLDSDRVGNNKLNVNHQIESKLFGLIECPPVAGAIAPLKILDLKGLEAISGKFKGIQGHHNSCYLDATLFSMFSFTSVFDSLLFRPPEPEDIQDYVEVQKVLREEIVNPLRKNIFVRADRVMKLRQLLDKLSSVSGLTSEEKDPEEFLNSLLAQIMRVEPFLKLSSGQDAFFYQLFVEKDERLSFPNVQQLFEQSFYSSDIKLKEVPSCLIIQMPRFGKNYKMYPRILPSQVLDITDIIEDSPRQCSVCGNLAEFECRDCFGSLQTCVSLESTGFCRICLDKIHMHAKRANHRHKKLCVPQDFRIMAEHMSVPRLYMELFAVVCIETSHYVAFVKASSGPDAPWCFFDSMADRKGEKNGYNIPELITVPDLPLWLSEDGARTVNETSTNDKMLPEHAKRLLCDAYMMMYQSTDVMMYR